MMRTLALVIATLTSLALASAAEAGCVWRGKGPACSGSCNGDELEIRRGSGIDAPFSTDGEPSFGAGCITGSKALCCTRCPSGLVWREKDGKQMDQVCVPPEEKGGKPKVTNKGCVIKGVLRKDIADTDCAEAQSTGCIHHLLTNDQYHNCLAANAPAYKPNKPFKTTGKKITATSTPAADGGPKATAVASDTVYKNHSGDQSAANKVCEMRSGDTATVVSTGPDKWVSLSGISGGCGGKSGWAWNEGELKLP